MRHSTRWSRFWRFMRNCRWSLRRSWDGWVERNVVTESHIEAENALRRLRAQEPHKQNTPPAAN